MDQLIGVSESHEVAVALGLVEPAIIVFPDGYYDSFWADTADGLLADSDVIDAIIPYVDSHFRSSRTCSARPSSTTAPS